VGELLRIVYRSQGSIARDLKNKYYLVVQRMGRTGPGCEEVVAKCNLPIQTV